MITHVGHVQKLLAHYANLFGASRGALSRSLGTIVPKWARVSSRFSLSARLTDTRKLLGEEASGRENTRRTVHAIATVERDVHGCDETEDSRSLLARSRSIRLVESPFGKRSRPRLLERFAVLSCPRSERVSHSEIRDSLGEKERPVLYRMRQ